MNKFQRGDVITDGTKVLIITDKDDYKYVCGDLERPIKFIEKFYKLVTDIFRKEI